MFWLAILYVLGAYFGKYNTLASVSKLKMLCVYAGCVLVTWGGKMLFVCYDKQLPFFVFNKNFLVSYMSPTILVAAIALLGVFVNLEIGEKAGKSISDIGSLAFGVYINHEQPFISKYFIKGRFAYLSEGSALEMMVTVIFAMILIFTVCAFLDAARQWMFKMLRVKEAVVFMESKVLNYLKEKDVI
jgi:surface polysaccharide O-acyltransferase-like enzyme